ncbi:MAG: tetratricopeptide repeat protein [Gemmatimonadaceae bacterium]|nr:tetratricopeptide repeat protein [Gemmatimonadaceae bacterium]
MAESPRIIELQNKFEDNPRRYFASLANEYRKAGDLQRAISICLIYLEKQPAHTAGHVVLGQAQYDTGKIDEAAETFKTVLALDPENLIALKCLGDIAQANGNLELAHDNFRQVLTADPRDHDASGRLKAVEQSLKLASTSSAEEWMPARSDEFAVPHEPPHAFASESTPSFSIESSPAFAIESTPVAEEPEAQSDMGVEIEAGIGPDAETEAVSIEDIYDPGEFPKAAPEDSLPQSLEVDDLPALEPPAVHEDIPEDDFLDTLLPSSDTEYHPAIAEPVALESAEETLAVPDLMEEADVPASPPLLDAGDGYQYRTAEFSLPDYGSSEPETGATSTEMEEEAEALLDEAEASIPPLPTFADFASSQHARTGEYSLSRDTGEGHSESAESPAFASTEKDEHANEMAGVEPAGPFITETVAELYLQQGFTGEALLVYRQIARSKPSDQRIAGRIADLEQRLADEHEIRQAALETPEEVLSVEPEPVFVESSPPPAPRAPAPAPVAAIDDDGFASAPAPHTRARQTVQEFFAVLGRAKAEVKRKPERMRVSADDIRAAADITAGFGVFGMEPAALSPKSIAAPVQGESDSQEDVRRFRAWLDGLSDS